LGIMGWSYGGYMTAWAITQTDRFKAASVGASFTNIYSFSLSRPDHTVEDLLGGQPWDQWQLYIKRSPVFHVKNVKTPTLIQHPEKDVIAPLSQGKEFYIALKKLDIPVEFAVYPRQGHAILYEPKLQRDMLRRNLDWFNRWIKGITP